MLPLISIIVPAYNTEKYIEKTLKSILSQNFKNFELIIVNDGSSDRTLEVVKKTIKSYSNFDANVKIITIPNQGVSVARNVGLEISVGEYIVFFDSDDIMLPEFLDILYNAISNKNADFAWVGYRSINEKGKILVHYCKKYQCNISDIMTGVDVLKLIFDGKLWLALWSGIYKRELINKFNLRFTRGVAPSQDIEFLYKYLFHAKKVVFVKQEAVEYLIRPGSNTRSSSVKKWFHVLGTLKRLSRYLNTYSADKELLEKFNKFFSSHFIYTVVLNVIKSHDKSALKMLTKLCEHNPQLINYVISHILSNDRISETKKRIFAFTLKHPAFSYYTIGAVLNLKHKLKNI